ncbi:hypothetical protein [Polyangium sp. y55x31]|uniref:hypothetical protein n=1 Tax=Polyangium sp. y55x31 TaxID=3042688 RepID=UPI0024831BF5|nr:hypothetical protein [Polyangium sp. y55x31]MDI1484338.1 hypothetical protein [Polyangium sp. y55x31]
MNEAQFSTGEDVEITNVKLTASPAPVVFDKTLYVFHQSAGNSGKLLYTTTDGATWTDDQEIRNVGMSASPSAVVFNGKLYVFHQGSGNSGALWYITSPNGRDWTNDQEIRDVGMSASPSAVVFNGKLYVFHQGRGDSGELWYTSSSNGTDWGPAQRVEVAGITASPSAVVFKNKLYVLYQGSGKSGHLFCSAFDGTSWAPPMQVLSKVMSWSPSAVACGEDLLSVFYQRAGEDGQLCYITFDGTNWSPNYNTRAMLTDSPAAIWFMHELNVYHQGAGRSGQFWEYTHDTLVVEEVIYHNSFIVTDEHPVRIDEKTIRNPDDNPHEGEVALSGTTTQTSHFENSTTSTISLTAGMEFRAKVPIVKKKFDGSFEMTFSGEETRTYGELQSTEVTISSTDKTYNPPWTERTYTLLVLKGTATVPYTMTLRGASGARFECEGQWSGVESLRQYVEAGTTVSIPHEPEAV